jgi:hypothetical protein
MSPLVINCSVAQCGKPVLARGLCSAHYQRWWKWSAPARIDPKEWLKDHSNYTGLECLIWPLCRNAAGYAQVIWNGKQTNAHRVMCEMAHGSPPSPKHQAAHSCGNGKIGCVHPEHLRWATPKENMADQVAHGTRRVGNSVPSSRLNDRDVTSIRTRLANGETHSSIAKKYGVARSTISWIKSGKTWRKI